MPNRNSSAERDPFAEWDPLRRLRLGDVAPFEAFCLNVEGRLLAYLNGLTKNAQEAEDLAQESLFRLYTMICENRVQPPKGSPSGLLFSIAHNVAMDSHRRLKHVVALDTRRTPAPATSAEQSLLRDQIGLAMEQLPENHRDALMLREFGSLSYREIAGALGASLSEVKVWIYRARTRMSQLLDRDGQYIGEQRHEM